MNNRNNRQEIVAYSTISILLIVLLLWGCPTYNVYRMKKKGEAELAKANYSKKVRVAEAEALKESASLLAQADTIRAHGTARTNQIIGASITSEYIQWMWVEGLKENQNASQYIYVPSGNLGIPVMESTRFINPKINTDVRPEASRK